MNLKGQTKVPKEVKLDILGIVEASPITKTKVIQLFDMCPVRYFRWQKKYYLDNCLEDRRGFNKKQPMIRLEDLYRQEIIDIRKNGNQRGFVIGPRRIMDALEEKNIFLSHETIRKILLNEGLINPRPRELVHEWRRFEAPAPNEIWQTDIMYVFVHGLGYVYLFSFLDDYSRKIIHWDLMATMSGQDAIEVLKTAIEKAGLKPNAILTDRGTQFYSGEGKKYGPFERFLEEQQIKHIVARYRHPQTLGKIERYHRSLREEKLNWFTFYDPIEAKRVIREYVFHYNYCRKHQGINRVTPEDKYTGRDREIIEKRSQLRRTIILKRASGKFTEKEILEDLVVAELTEQFKSISLTKEVVLV